MIERIKDKMEQGRYPEGKHIAALVEYYKAAEYGFKVRGEWQCKHKHPGPDNICAACLLIKARAELEKEAP